MKPLTTHEGLGIEDLLQLTESYEQLLVIGVAVESKNKKAGPRERGEWVRRFWNRVREDVPSWLGRQLSWDSFVFLAPATPVEEGLEVVQMALRREGTPLIVVRMVLKSVKPGTERLPELDRVMGILSARHNFEAPANTDVVKVVDGFLYPEEVDYEGLSCP